MSDDPDKALRRWQAISDLVLTARVRGRAIESNPALDHYIDEDPKGPLAAAMAVWRADNFVFERHFDEGAKAHEAAARRHEHDDLRGVSWAAYAYDQAATCHEQRGRTDDALGALDALLGVERRGSEAWIHHRRGGILEAAGRDAEAIDAYRKGQHSKDDPPASEVPIPDLARRAADRLEQGKRLEPFPDRLATQLTRALERGDLQALRDLASPTHFTVGIAGSELKFVAADQILPYLKEALGRVQLRADPAALEGKGEKRYLYTDGWQGPLLRGRVYFLLTRSRDGWQWSGVVLTQVDDAYVEVFPPVEPATNQLPQIVLKAPYPAGVCFRAGGLDRFARSFLPFIGSFIFFEDLFSSCGYGPGGFYYNQGATHQGQDAFSIDFTRYVTGVPYALAAGGIHALAVQFGMVTMVRSSIPSGATSIENRVTIDHPSVGELIGAIFGIPLPAQLKFRSQYLHLAGPGMIFVSPGMFVRQGARLGPINDTGNSAFDHLHFSLHDRDLIRGGVGYQSVRPTPMDGQSLEDGNGGACICSTNVPFP